MVIWQCCTQQSSVNLSWSEYRNPEISFVSRGMIPRSSQTVQAKPPLLNLTVYVSKAIPQPDCALHGKNHGKPWKTRRLIKEVVMESQKVSKSVFRVYLDRPTDRNWVLTLFFLEDKCPIRGIIPYDIYYVYIYPSIQSTTLVCQPLMYELSWDDAPSIST